MHKEVEKYLRLKRKLIVLEYARVFGSNTWNRNRIKSLHFFSCISKKGKEKQW